MLRLLRPSNDRASCGRRQLRLPGGGLRRVGSRARGARVRVALGLGVVLALTLLVGPPAAYAATISVTTTDDELNSDGDCSLREAIEAANTNAPVDACAAGEPAPTVDVIGFSATGTITLGSTLPVISEAVTIDGPGAANLTISGGNAVRVLEVGAGAALDLKGVTVANGSAPDGGGILAADGTLVVTNSTLSGNSSSAVGCCGHGGGAIHKTGGGSLTLTNSILLENTAESGGAILNAGSGASLTITDSTLSGNSALGHGGGIVHGNGSVTITNSTFWENSAQRGGGMYYFGPLTVTDSTFSRNSASGFPGGGGGGGGISAAGGTMTVANSTFSENSAGTNGGAIQTDAGTYTVTNSTFFGNSAAQDGGGILNSGGGFTVTNSTFSGNSAARDGGAIAPVGPFTLVNSIVANSPSGGNCLFPITDGGGNLQYPGTDCGGTITSADPLLDPAGLQNNGGPTETIALLPGSPAIDAAVACPPPPTDQREVSRPQGAGCDIGAFELEVTTVAVLIDIKPNAFPNRINPRSKDKIPVAVLTAGGFDAATIDPATALFGATGTEASPVKSALKDVDGDGDKDLLLHFKTNQTGIACGDTSALLTGETFGGQAIAGSDSIKTVGCT